MKQRLLIGSLLTLLAIITFIAAAPILSVVVSGVVASALHCPLDEGSIHPCFYHGRDIGSTLYTLGVLGWLMLFTIPVLFVSLLGWIGVAIVWITRRRASRRENTSTPET